MTWIVKRASPIITHKKFLGLTEEFTKAVERNIQSPTKRTLYIEWANGTHDITNANALKYLSWDHIDTIQLNIRSADDSKDDHAKLLFSKERPREVMFHTKSSDQTNDIQKALTHTQSWKPKWFHKKGKHRKRMGHNH